MKNIILRQNSFFSISIFLSLLSSPVLSHPGQVNEHGMGHALLSTGHVAPLVMIGAIVGILMLSRKKALMLIGNLGLFSYLFYEVFIHSIDNSLLFGLEFLLIGGFLALASWRVTYWIFKIGIMGMKSLKSMLHQSIDYINRFIKFPSVQAHCDIPCKIYDPAIAIISALSVVRLIDIIEENRSNGDKLSADYDNTITRCIQRKEEESEKLKQEIRVIWGDYFKEPQFNKFPKIHSLTHQIMILASAVKQKIDREDASQLLELVNQFSEVFWSTKGVETERKISPYPPSLSVVRPKL
jgi:nickel superoxide dismutase